MKIFTKSPNLAVTMSRSQVSYCVNFRIEEKKHKMKYVSIYLGQVLHYYFWLKYHGMTL